MEPTAKDLASKPLTKRSALVVCLEHWNYVAESENGSWVKEEVFLSMLPEANWLEACACCQYEETHTRTYCEKSCLLRWSSDTGHCNDIGGEYDAYCENPTKQSALAIAYLAESALDALEKE